LAVSTYHQVYRDVRSSISETLVPTKTLNLQDWDVSQVKMWRSQPRRKVWVMLQVGS